MDNYRSDLDRDDRAQYDEDLSRYKANMSADERYLDARARHMINPENAHQQESDIRYNHSLKDRDYMSRGESY